MTLGGGDDAGLAGGAAALVALAAEVDVIGLHDRRPAGLGRRAQLAAIALLRHRVAQAFVQIPGCRIADAQATAEFDRGDALLGAAHQVHGPEPSGQRQLGVGHHGARSDRPAHVAPGAADPAVVDVALRVATARARHARVLARLYPCRQTLLFGAVQPLERGVRQPLDDWPHRFDLLVLGRDSALNLSTVIEGGRLVDKRVYERRTSNSHFGV